MASILYGGGIVNARGSIAGTTLSRNGAGAHAKGRTKGVNPKTTSQQSARSIMSHLIQVWRYTLSNADRAAWATYGLSNPTLNAFGQTITLSGWGWFCKLNAKCYASGWFTQTTPPVSNFVHSPLSLVLAFSHTGPPYMNVTYTSSGIAAPEVMQIWTTGALPPGRAFVSSQLRLVSGHGVDGTYDIATDWKGIFGSLPTGAGQLSIVRIAVCNTQTGIVSTSLQGSTTWT